jgi:hypothetical protein
MGAMMRARGYLKPVWFQVSVVAAWLGGEFLAGVIYGIVKAARGEPPTQGIDFAVYGLALLGAALCTTMVFLIARTFPNRAEPPPPLS